MFYQMNYNTREPVSAIPRMASGRRIWGRIRAGIVWIFGPMGSIGSYGRRRAMAVFSSGWKEFTCKNCRRSLTFPGAKDTMNVSAEGVHDP